MKLVLNKMQILRTIYTLCLMSCALGMSAQHNVYINETVDGYNRVRIVHQVSQVDFTPKYVTFWSNTDATPFDASAINLMTLKEHDAWRYKAMPERYHADFDFDIAFDEADKERVQAEKEETDTSSKYYDDFIAHTNWTKTVNIVFDGENAHVTGDTDSLTITQEGAHLTITTAATGLKYILSGQSQNAGFKLYSERKACIVLNGVTLTNPTGPVINSQLKKRLFIDLAANTVNTLTDGASYTKVKNEDQRGCIFAEGKLCFSGKGQLYVNANKKCGIASDNYVHQMDGFIHVDNHAKKGKAVYGKDHVIIGGGVLRAYCNGLASKGVASDSLLWITGGVVKTITTGNAVWEEEEEDYSSCCGIKSNWDMILSGGEISCLSTGSGGKGISAGHQVVVNENKTDYHGTLTIYNADIYVRTSGKRIPEVKDEDSHGNKIGAAASPKGIKSSGKITFNSGNIYVRCSGGAAAEGIESKKTIDINGGKIRSYSVDDGMNAEGCNMRGGDVLICSTENDGFDVSFLFMYDGLLYTIGGDVAQMGLDTDGKTFKVLGGEIIGLGARNCLPYASSEQASVLCYVKGKSISGLALADAEGHVITAVPTPNSYNTVSVLFSNSNIIVGNSYKILSYEKSFNDTPVTEYEFTQEKQSLTLGSFK